jgi:hypothetical protein
MRNVIMFLAGASLGWLTGLSVSPVIQGVLTAVLGVVISGVSVLAGLAAPPFLANKDTPKPEEAKPSSLGEVASRVQFLPVAVLTIGLAAGATLGVFARTHDWLGSRLDTKAAANTGVSTEEQKRAHIAGLFSAATPSECVTFRNALTAESLPDVLAAATNEHVRQFVRKTNGDVRALKAAVEEWICPAEK